MCLQRLFFVLIAILLINLTSTNNVVRKCCHLNYAVENGTCIQSNLTVNLTNLTIIYGDGLINCSESEARFPFFNSEFIIENNGNLYIPFARETFNYSKYCVDFIENEWMALVCAKKAYDEVEMNRNLRSAKGKPLPLLKKTLIDTAISISLIAPFDDQ